MVDGSGGGTGAGEGGERGEAPPGQVSFDKVQRRILSSREIPPNEVREMQSGRTLRGQQTGGSFADPHPVRCAHRPSPGWGLAMLQGEGAWQVTTTDTEITLLNLERGVEYDFRVVAANAAGDSLPSNVVTVVL